MRRREFIAGLGSAVGWPLAARAQQDARVRRIGMLFPGVQNSRGSRLNLAALREGLGKLGWIEGHNLRIDLRYGADDPDIIHASAAELVGLGPDVLVTSSSTTRAVRETTQTIPIIITSGGDPVAIGLIQDIARPEGNITGFISAEPSIASKWLELLKEAAPRVTRVAIVFNPELGPAAPSYLALIEAAALALGIAAIKTPVRNAIDIVHAIDAFAAEPNGGLLVLPPPTAAVIRDTIIQLAERHRLPAIYPQRLNVAAGGLMSYGTDLVDQHRRAATYIDRILRGAKVSELPVQFPAKFELVINLKTAKAIGLTIAEAFLLRADEVIE
jgi:putative ABC transport system substrate-binding protein